MANKLSLKLNTSQFIVKEFLPSTDMEQINSSQKIAALLKKHGVPAVLAIRSEQKANKHYCLTFPYIEGHILQNEQVRPEHVQHIALLLQKIHQAQLNVDFAPSLETYSITMQDWQNWANALALSNPELSQFLKAQFDWLKSINAECIQACSMAPKDSVISHRDLSLSNVIWQNEQALIIDWDWAGKISQAQDVLATALNWSLKSDASIDLYLFKSFMQAYELPLIETEWQLGFYRVLANWLNWVALNIKYYLAPKASAEFKLKLQNQIQYSLKAALYLYQRKTKLHLTAALK
ncbi:MAG: putative aminoglycoside phosphotransferase [Gammaproteobacteria bacterium]|nr:putative aminoglycoside phosphotransferase [Gammaproteobacteria bacterium]